jgi:hypothetical protein
MWGIATACLVASPHPGPLPARGESGALLAATARSTMPSTCTWGEEGRLSRQRTVDDALSLRVGRGGALVAATRGRRSPLPARRERGSLVAATRGRRSPLPARRERGSLVAATRGRRCPLPARGEKGSLVAATARSTMPFPPHVGRVGCSLPGACTYSTASCRGHLNLHPRPCEDSPHRPSRPPTVAICNCPLTPRRRWSPYAPSPRVRGEGWGEG